ncbi:MAG: hypothetical protein KF729_25835 [Sandaracinaceae bacterium]|nr:hypothetical protein [Sandaracinaceae bacterium]
MRALSLTLALIALPAPGHAQGDGVYGRLAGDLALEAGLGGGVAFEGADPIGAAVLDLRARYLDMAGILASVEVRPEGASRVAIGVDLRPVWLARFVLGASLGDRFWDLLFDSIGLDLGVALTPLDERVGAALMVGFGLDVPLVFFGDGVEGLALRLFGRHVAALAQDRFGPDAGAHDWVVGAALVLRGATRTGLPAWEPRRYEVP